EQRGVVDVGWDAAQRCLAFDYRAEHDGRTLHRATRVRIAASASAPERDGRRLRFPLDLAPRGVWSATLRYESLVDGRWRTPLEESPAGSQSPGTTRDRERDRWPSERPRLDCAHRVVGPAFAPAAAHVCCPRDPDI